MRSRGVLAGLCLVLPKLLTVEGLARMLSVVIPLASQAVTVSLAQWSRQAIAELSCSVMQAVQASAGLGILLGTLRGCYVLGSFGFGAGGVHPPPEACPLTSWSDYLV